MQVISPDHTIILAKIRHIEELERLAICTQFVEIIGQIVHQIQTERGASALFLASAGQSFAKERADIIMQNQVLDALFQQGLQRHLHDNLSVDARQLTLISWILLGFDELKSLRHQVTLHKISFPDCIQSFNRFIGSLVSLLFEISDNTVNNKLSTSLLALYNLVQGKEFAGQERAVGAYMFGSGAVELQHQQKLLELIALQDRHFALFNQFASPALTQTWDSMARRESQQQHQQYRDKLSMAKAQQRLQVATGDVWFVLCSQRLSEIWQIQCALIADMHQSLNQLVQEAKQDLEHTRQYLQQLQRKPQTATTLDSTFFNLSIPVERAYAFLGEATTPAYPMESIISLLQQQSQQIAEIESELSDTKKALAERKVIERAKGMLMTRLAISEVEAYKILRSSAMEQNRKLVDVAENILAQQPPRAD